MAIVKTDSQNYTNIANAINSKAGKNETYLPSEMAQAIKDIPTGEIPRVSKPIKDINFFDYDGTCVYSYNWSEFQLLGKNPEQPVHEGLIGQGWNWTYDEIMQSGGICDVGALYQTNDKSIRLYFDFNNPYFNDEYRTVIIQSSAYAKPNRREIIDWGDGSPIEYFTSSFEKKSHTYTKNGKYKITYKSEHNIDYFSCGLSKDIRNNATFYSLNKIETPHILDGFGFDYIKPNTQIDETVRYGVKEIVWSRNFDYIDIDYTYIKTIFCHKKASSTVNINNNNNLIVICFNHTNGNVVDFYLKNNPKLVRLVLPKRISGKFPKTQGCSSLENVYILNDEVVNLENIDNLPNKGDNASFKVYVPANLVDQYKVATNWVQHADRIFPIELH